MKSKIINYSLLLLAVVFIGNQIISSFYKPIKTETAVYHTVSDGFNITGLIIRNEILVHYDGGGVMHFVTDDGSRVAKAGVIADIYNSENASITVSEIKSIEAKIKDITDILSYNDIESANLDLINSRVESKVDDLIFATSKGEYSTVSTCADELLSAINHREAAMGNVADFSVKLEQLNSRLNELKVALPQTKGQILAEESGYFVSKTDGYEQVFSSKDLTLFTPDFLKEAKQENLAKNVIGKIVSDYEWYIAASVSVNQSLNYKEGEVLKIETSVKSSPEITATVKQIIISDNGENAVVIFACNDMNSELASMRSGPMTVIKDEYSGLRVPKKALRVVDSQRGVYVLSGMQIKFIPVQIVYSNESFIICKKDNDSRLRLYDQVVVKGKNLYDGKIVG